MKLSQIHFPESRIGKLALVVVSLLIALVLLGIIGLKSGWFSLGPIVIFILSFPAGLVFFLNGSPQMHTFVIIYLGVILWPLYVGFTFAITLIKNPYISRILYFVVILLLIANVSGCASFLN